MSYQARYRCMRCQHGFEVTQGVFGCPEGHREPDLDSPCGRSQRQYRCASCAKAPRCPQCGYLWVEWLNYQSLVVTHKLPVV